MLIACFIVGTLTTTQPFKLVLDINDDIKHYWAETLGKPPYGHAELSSFKTFCKRMGYEMEEALEILQNNNIRVKNPKDSLQEIAKYNNTTPAKIYDIIFEELL